MSDEPIKPMTLEQLETEIIGLKVRLSRIERFILDMPDPSTYIEDLNEDEIIEEAKKVIDQYDRVSASLLQRRLSIGYARASRLIDILENKKLIAPSDGSSKPREVYRQNDEQKKKD